MLNTSDKSLIEDFFLNNDALVVGIDFGTLSGRALVVRISDGKELGSAIFEYPHAVMESRITNTDVFLPTDWALQVPQDYIEVLKNAVPMAISNAEVDPARIIAIGTDFTACTVLPVLSDGTPLCELPDYSNRPHAYVKLWKHHAAQAQADRINLAAANRGESWLGKYGGLISSEWEFAKALEMLEGDSELYERMDHWIEAADWIVWQLTGSYVRNACSAGYKGILQDGSYPSKEFLTELNPKFATFVTDKLSQPIGKLGDAAGRLTAEAAGWTGLREGIIVAVGNIDAHVTAPAAQAVEAGQMLAIMGTSTCHILNSETLRDVPGSCGVVAGGVIQGLFGYEAGQSGTGDIFEWFTENLVPGRYQDEASALGISLHDYLTELTKNQPVGAHGLVALDWLSGNRSILVDHNLTGLILGMTLHTTAEEIYRALMEATAFGTRLIIENFIKSGIPVDEFIVAGGLLKNRNLMQMYSDILNMPISTIASGQGPALGSAIHAAVAAGAYPDVYSASKVMGGINKNEYLPNDIVTANYDHLYKEYLNLHNYFGNKLNETMHRIKAKRNKSVIDGALYGR